MHIRELIARNQHAIISASSSDSVRDAARLLAEKRIGALPVLDGDRLVGIFSERDVIYGLAADADGALDKSLADAMTLEPVTVDGGTTVLAALSLMSRRRIRHLPVMEGDRLIGFVSIGDLVKSRIELIEAEAEAMREYIQSV